MRRYSAELMEELHRYDNETKMLLRFGYHVYLQDFPQNIVINQHRHFYMEEQPQRHNDDLRSSLEINHAFDLRPRNCPYGRLMRAWRRERTEDDTKPFPTIS